MGKRRMVQLTRRLLPTGYECNVNLHRIGLRQLASFRGLRILMFGYNLLPRRAYSGASLTPVPWLILVCVECAGLIESSFAQYSGRHGSGRPAHFRPGW